jgi:hypothetical protein
VGEWVSACALTFFFLLFFFFFLNACESFVVCSVLSYCSVLFLNTASVHGFLFFFFFRIIFFMPD